MQGAGLSGLMVQRLRVDPFELKIFTNVFRSPPKNWTGLRYYFMVPTTDFGEARGKII